MQNAYASYQFTKLIGRFSSLPPAEHDWLAVHPVTPIHWPRVLHVSKPLPRQRSRPA
jgi:hypothetical protein